MQKIDLYLKPCSFDLWAAWLLMRRALWPETTAEGHEQEMKTFLENPERYAQFLAYTKDGVVAGFLEASLRFDYVNGAESSPVAFIEGLYTAPELRNQGVARALMQTAEKWALDRGCTELASDALIDNSTSHKAHKALGFTETERVVYFRKMLA